MWTPEKNDETCTLLQTKNRTGIKNLEAFTTYSECDSFLTGLACHAMPHWHTFLVSCVESLLLFSQNDHSACSVCLFAAAEVSLKAHHTPLTSPFSSMTCVKLVTYVQLGPWSTRRMSPSEYEKIMTKSWLSRNASFATHHFEILRDIASNLSKSHSHNSPTLDLLERGIPLPPDPGLGAVSCPWV